MVESLCLTSMWFGEGEREYIIQTHILQENGQRLQISILNNEHNWEDQCNLSS